MKSMSTKQNRIRKTNCADWIDWRQFTPFKGERKSTLADMSAIRSGTYWVMAIMDGTTQAEADFYGVEAKHAEVPHPKLTNFSQSSPAALLRALRKCDKWSPCCFNNTNRKIARVKLTRHGFTVRIFNTYREACTAHSLATDKI
jgi:hypothetical protein